MKQPPQQGNFYDAFQGDRPNVSELKAPKRRNPELESVQNILSDISSGLRILEDRYSNLRKKTQLTDQTLLDAQRNFEKEKQLLQDELMDVKMKLQDLTDDLKIMQGELQEAVKQKDFKVIEKYLDMWEPLQFVTRKEVEELLEDNIEDEDLFEEKKV